MLIHSDSPSLSRISAYVHKSIALQSRTIASIQNHTHPLVMSAMERLADLGTHSAYLLALPCLVFINSGTQTLIINTTTTVDVLPLFALGLVMNLCMGVCVTAWLKDFCCWPRPFEPIVKRFSRHQETSLEFGFPSTHSCNAM